MLDLPNYPVKTRELHNHHFDSTIWNDFTFRDDDIVISTYAKSGTTWMQQIVSQLIFDGAEGLPVAEMSPWLDLTGARAQGDERPLARDAERKGQRRLRAPRARRARTGGGGLAADRKPLSREPGGPPQVRGRGTDPPALSASRVAARAPPRSPRRRRRQIAPREA